jgi:NAD(P)-dependent dehydrogenase (short-subunit alcohol dehydrogenase family)
LRRETSGARVAVTYHRNREGAEETARKVREAGGEALVVEYDLAAPKTIRASLERVEHEWGTLHALVNNAAPMDTAGPSKGPSRRCRWSSGRPCCGERRTQRHLSPEHREQIKARAPTRQLTTPDDVAAVIVFLGSPLNRQITGEVIRVTGGR